MIHIKMKTSQVEPWHCLVSTNSLTLWKTGLTNPNNHENEQKAFWIGIEIEIKTALYLQRKH